MDTDLPTRTANPLLRSVGQCASSERSNVIYLARVSQKRVVKRPVLVEHVKLTRVGTLPLCERCGFVLTTTHEDACRRFFEHRKLERDRIARLFRRCGRDHTVNVTRAFMIEYQSIRSYREMKTFLDRLRQYFDYEDHKRQSELYGISLGFIRNCEGI